MENYAKFESNLHQENDPAQPNIDPVPDVKHQEKINQIEKDLNTKILEITMVIKDHYPELSKYLDEMLITIPDEQHAGMTLDPLLSYYESLVSMVAKYQAEHQKTENENK